MRFAGSAASDVGVRREHNEDAAFFGATGEMVLAVVADGMGGAASGRPAADLAIGVARATFARRFTVLAETWWREEHGGPLPAAERMSTAAHVRALLETRRAITLGDAGVLDHGLGDLVRTALVAANAAIHRRSHEKMIWRGMGAAVVAAVFTAEGVAIGHAGDSRIYRLRAGKLQQLTRDHSLINDYLLAMPTLTEEQLAELPKNIITRALGMSEHFTPDIAEHAAAPGDTWLLLSDGVLDVLGDDAIIALVDEHGAGAATQIVEAGRHRAEDNLSAVVVSVT